MKFVFSAIAGDGRSSVGRRVCVCEDGQYSRDEQNRFFSNFVSVRFYRASAY